MLAPTAFMERMPAGLPPLSSSATGAIASAMITLISGPAATMASSATVFWDSLEVGDAANRQSKMLRAADAEAPGCERMAIFVKRDAPQRGAAYSSTP